MYTGRALSKVEMPYYRPRDLNLLLHHLLTDLVISRLTSSLPFSRTSLLWQAFPYYFPFILTSQHLPVTPTTSPFSFSRICSSFILPRPGSLVALHHIYILLCC